MVGGTAVQEAKTEFAGQERDRRISEALPIAWQQLLTGPDELLSELLAEAVAGVSGHRPDPEVVAQFLFDFTPPTNVALPPPVSEPTRTDPLRTLTHAVNATSFTGKQPVAFTLSGQRHEVATWRELLTGSCDLAASHVGDRFAGLVQTIRGSKRTYFASSPDGLVAPLAMVGGLLFV